MIARSLKNWLAKEKVSKSKNKEEGESQNVTAAAAVVKKKDGEQETMRRRGAQCASEFATVATLAEIASSSEERSGNAIVSTEVERHGRRMFHHEVASGQPLVVYGDCVHINPQCRGLRNRRTAAKNFRTCPYCHEDNLKHVEFAGSGRSRTG